MYPPDNQVPPSGPAGPGNRRARPEKLHHIAPLNPPTPGPTPRTTPPRPPPPTPPTPPQNALGESMARGHVEYYGGSAEEPAQYRYQNGAKVLIGGMDKPSKIMSSEYDVIYAQEATELTVTDWEALTTRLRNGKVSFQQLMADCN